VTRSSRGRAYALSLVTGLAALLALTACGPSQPIAPVSISDPLGLASNAVTVSLSYDSGVHRFLGTTPSQTFPDLQASLLPPFSLSSYTLTLSIGGATVTGPTAPPATFALDAPGASVTLSDPTISGLQLDSTGSAGPWTFQQTSGGSYDPAGNATLSMTVTDASTLSQLVQLLTAGGDNTAVIAFGAASSGVPTGDTLVLQFGAGSEVFSY